MDTFFWHAKLKLAGWSGKAKKTFEGSHKTRKEAIEIAAQKAYEWMVQRMHTNSELLKPVICEDDRPLADRIASCCQDLFEKLCRNVIRAPSSSDVIAAFLLRDTTTGEMEIVALASGSKCIRGRHLSDEGLAVQDCHAEIVARRAFLRYLYQELEKLLCAPEECIFELIKKSGKIRLKPQYEVHLYINKPPCGDATNFTRAGKEDGTRWETEPHQPCWQASSCKNVRKMGLLRKKIECGEGGVLLDAGNLDCLQQDWEKLTSSISLSSDNPEYRLRTMSCSDKILKWNRVGVQGAALSMIVQPIFLVSLFIGDEDLFHHGHIVRGVCCRFTSPMLSNSLPSAKKMNHPKLVSVHSPVEARNYTDNTADFSLNWYKGAPEPECVDTDTGKAMPLPYISDSEPLGSKEYTPSQLCKRELFAIFHQTYKRVHKKPFPGNKTYSEAKKTAGKYQKVKEQFYEDLLNSGCGTWDKKPAQVDDFRI